MELVDFMDEEKLREALRLSGELVVSTEHLLEYFPNPLSVEAYPLQEALLKARVMEATVKQWLGEFPVKGG